VSATPVSTTSEASPSMIPSPAGLALSSAGGYSNDGGHQKGVEGTSGDGGKAASLVEIWRP